MDIDKIEIDKIDVDRVVIGQRIRKRREALHMTREKFSEYIDVTTKFCSDIELGASGMSLKTLMRISKVLSMSTDYILFGNEHDSKKTEFTLFAEAIPKAQSDYYLRLCKEAQALSDSLLQNDSEDDFKLSQQ